MPSPYMGAKIHQLAQTSPEFLCVWEKFHTIYKNVSTVH